MIYEKKYLEFETSHLSKYGIVGTAIKSPIIPIVNPATADKLYMEIIMFIAFLSVSIFACLKIKKIKNA